MARKKKIDLATAKTADGALKAPTSVYEMVGIPTTSYGSKTFQQYQRELEGMSLWELQDHAQKSGVLPNSNRTIIIDRLEKEFLKAHSKYAPEVVHGGKNAVTSSEQIQNEAAKILSRGR